MLDRGQHTPLHHHARNREWRAGFAAIIPVAIAAVPIGLLFGALCSAKGLTVAEAGLMSALVFAGGSQFAAIELWAAPVPIAALVFSTLLINARHVLMGASLTPKTQLFSPLQRYLGFHFLTDETWALAERRAVAAPLTPAYWFALATLLPTAWVGSTLVGAAVGSLLGDPRSIGADFAFTALFIGLIAGFWRGRTTAITIAASGGAAALTYLALGPPWHVAAGAMAGIAAAYATAPETETETEDVKETTPNSMTCNAGSKQ
ncbi:MULTISPECIES: AzlC family ABC transporter permease [unclassified Chelatococcus]|uniref:AzlC family ABC transporter permease n=1 Tax=unclassified Chelatococcus TaxID=2638111 RepID=UPI001BD0509C|nr:MULTISPECIES: AzlC family ABC transporter permease [unclassified Chelatococcus]MBS7697929.1 AzlC family ABC transporter permease [Chelatococcus sp. YT9]MBX3558494.1 AzlC family ABC transporter permease [Chelatococcus sp.]